MSNEFDFGSLEIIEIPVVGPDGKNYILRETSGDAAAQFNSMRAKCAKYAGGDVSEVTGVGQIPLFLVSLCLFNVKEDGAINLNSPVAPGVLRSRSWPERVIKRLYAKALEISEIDQDDDLDSLRKQYQELGEKITKMEEDAAKNEQNTSGTGSNLPANEELPTLSESS